MTAANFPAELADELVFEGGFVNDPQDPGGITDFGITLATLSHFEGRQATVTELTGMSEATKATIYRSMFWNLINGDQLPSGIDLMVFDMAVNGGPGRAAAMLQRILRVPDDGVIGPGTIQAARDFANQAYLISAYAAARLLYYRSLPTFARFGAGWIARVNKVEAEALALLL
jgi:lysozyme family protein